MMLSTEHEGDDTFYDNMFDSAQYDKADGLELALQN